MALRHARAQLSFVAQPANTEQREASIKRNNNSLAAVGSQGGVIPMIILEECAEFAALQTNELFTGAVLSAKHRSLLSSYLLNLKRGPIGVRKMIVADIRMAIDLGASKHAADLILVLRMYLAKYLEARIQRPPARKPVGFTTCRLDRDYRVTCISGR
jgi:hypothetical protein